MIDDELDATRPYRYMDYDGESLTLRQSRGTDKPFLIAEYAGEGGVYFGGTDDVLRTALAMLARGADKGTPFLKTIMFTLLAAIEEIEDNRLYKRGQTVEVWDACYEAWVKGVVMGYHDDGEYSIHPEGCGIFLSYAVDKIRALPEEGN